MGTSAPSRSWPCVQAQLVSGALSSQSNTRSGWDEVLHARARSSSKKSPEIDVSSEKIRSNTSNTDTQCDLRPQAVRDNDSTARRCPNLAANRIMCGLGDSSGNCVCRDCRVLESDQCGFGPSAHEVPQDVLQQPSCSMAMCEVHEKVLNCPCRHCVWNWHSASR